MGVTARGVGLFVAAGVLLAAGFRFAYPELALLGAAGATAGGYAVAVAAWRPRLAVVRRAEPDRVARGEPATMTVTVHNRGRLRSANLVAEDRCGAVPVAVPVLRLRPGRDTTVRYDVPTTRRGVVPVGPLRVIRRDPLGLVSLSRPYGETVPVWVHPRVHPLSVVPTGAGRSLDGQVDAVPHGSITFDSLREYVVGDELRRVHWRTSARVGELMVRENVDTSLPRLVVLLDNRAVAHPQRSAGLAESFEAACEAAASVLTAAHRSDLPVVLVLVAPEDEGSRAGVAESGAARSGLSPLDRLAAAGLGGDTLDATLTRLRGERRGDTLVALTGPGGRDSLGQFGALRGAYPSVVVGVLAAAEPAQAQTAGLVVIDAADGAAFAAEWDRVRRW
ncbi:DUF58 domain-containing protein [Salinispora arenicola]|uniref:DUF58 domain-containing protein n=1 Tax=Salinispora arenicola TaxID=168697 RepID=UPI000490FCA7|nr:DUF58 domain-containing protein [Salinispora arenicola]MCN0151872.1 DUF58 domain-containing protein [Salinispora arenicola]